MIPQRGVSVVGYGIGVVAWDRLKRHGVARFGVGWTWAGLGPGQVRSRELRRGGVGGLGLALPQRVGWTHGEGEDSDGWPCILRIVADTLCSVERVGAVRGSAGVL